MGVLNKNFFKQHLKLLIILLLGIVLLVVVKFMNTDNEMSATLRLLRYTSLLFISLSLFLLFMKNKKVILGNIMLLALLLILTETTCFFLLGMPKAINKDFGLPYLPENHISTHLGSVPYADSVYHKVLIKENDTVYDVNYSIDENNLRITPDHNTEKKEFALFFGCSIAFGEGLNDNETLPYQFQENSKKYNSYNFAYSGYGTNHMLARMQYQNLSDNVIEKEGVAFYIFFWDHIQRAIGTMDRYCSWGSNAPYYTFEDDKLVRKKKFKDGRYYLSKFYELIYQTNIVKQFKIALPLELNDSHYDLISEMILESKNTYKEQFGNDNFYVVFYPNYIEYTEEQMSQFQAFLTKKNIHYIDLNNFIKYEKKYTLGGDPHPNAKTNGMISKEILKQINSYH